MPLNDAAGDDFADVLDLGELVHAGGEHGVQVGEIPAERLGHAGPDVEDAQSVKDAPHVARFAGGDTFEKIARGLLAHPFEIGEFIQLEPVEAGNVVNQSALHQLNDQHFATA